MTSAPDDRQPGDPTPLPGPTSGRLLNWYSNTLFAEVPAIIGLFFTKNIGWWWAVLMIAWVLLVGAGGLAISFRSNRKNTEELQSGYTTRGGVARRSRNLYQLDPKTLRVLYRPPSAPE